MEELTPNTRYEKFLSAAAGSVSAPDPVTREEKFLKAIADNAGGGSSLPDDPAQDGTYNLQNTVSSGTGTLSWASGGSSGRVLVVGVTVSDGFARCDKTCKEMWDAMKTGAVVLDGITFVYTVVNAINDAGYQFITFDNLSFTGTTDNDYPKASLS